MSISFLFFFSLSCSCLSSMNAHNNSGVCVCVCLCVRITKATPVGCGGDLFYGTLAAAAPAISFVISSPLVTSLIAALSCRALFARSECECSKAEITAYTNNSIGTSAMFLIAKKKSKYSLSKRFFCCGAQIGFALCMCVCVFAC